MLSGNDESSLEPQTSSATSDKDGVSKSHDDSECLKRERKIQIRLELLADSFGGWRGKSREKVKKDPTSYNKYALAHIHSRQKGLCVPLN